MKRLVVDGVIMFLALLLIIFGAVAFAERVQEEIHAAGFIGTLHHDRNEDRQLSYFRISFPDGTSLLVAGDQDLPAVRWLKQYAGSKIRIKHEASTGLGRLER